MKIILNYIISFVSLIVINGCDLNETDALPVNSQSNKLKKVSHPSGIGCIYSNSFESPDDTSGWYGIEPGMFVNDPAPKGGCKSLLIGGGCLQPIAFRSIHVNKEGFYNISFWGKTENQGGFVEFIFESDAETTSKQIWVNSKNWTHYTIRSLYCPKESVIKINMFIGGIIFASTNIDELIISKNIMQSNRNYLDK